ncbi:MAG: repeat protein [Planctomycetota bacterium]|nr:repeat protein [Planctomycetota bacterium]
MPIISLLLVALGTSFAPADADDPAIGEIRAVLDRQVADWNRKDLDAFCEGYWNSPKLVFQSAGDRTEGWQAMRERYRKRYQGEGREMGTLAFLKLEIEPLGAASAFARGRWQLTLSDGKTVGGLFTLILRKRPEGWRIIHDHTSSDAK